MSSGVSFPLRFARFGKSVVFSWAEVENSAGRLIVSVLEPSFGGLFVNDPLADQEDRIHGHPFTAAVNLNAKNIAADPHDNDQGALKGR